MVAAFGVDATRFFLLSEISSTRLVLGLGLIVGIRVRVRVRIRVGVGVRVRVGSRV